jgi:hypothetical protein
MMPSCRNRRSHHFTPSRSRWPCPWSVNDAQHVGQGRAADAQSADAEEFAP